MALRVTDLRIVWMRLNSRMSHRHEELRQIVRECDSLVFYAPPEHGISRTRFRRLPNGIKIIRQFAILALRKRPRRLAVR